MANSKQYILSLFPDNNNNEISAADMRIFVSAIFDEEIDTTAIIDNLFSTDGRVPLSANQGRVLNDKIIQAEIDILRKEDDLGIGSEHQILTMDRNHNKVWETPQSFTETIVIDRLDSVSSTNALSANMGRVLSETVNASSLRINDNTNEIALNSAKIIVNSDNIADNLEKIDINSSAIISHTTQIDALVTKSTNNENAINNNNAKIQTNLDLTVVNKDDIILVNSKVDANFTLIDNLNLYTGINDTTNNFNLGTLNERIEINVTDIAALQVLNGGVDLTALQNQVSINKLNIITNGNGISSNLGLINANTGLINTLTTSVSVNSGNINTNATNIQIVQTDLITLTGRVNSNLNFINSNALRIGDNEANIATNTAKINVNNLNILQNIDDIANNLNRIQTNTTDIFNNKQDIEILQVEVSNNIINIANNNTLTKDNLNNISALRADLITTNNDLTTLSIVVSGNDDGSIPGKEDNLGIPTIANSGYILSAIYDTTNNVWSRTWVENAFSASEFGVVDNLNEVGNDFDALSANQGYVLDQKVATKESDLGIPALDGMILSANQDGSRNWVQANVLNVDYGSFFGTGFSLVSIEIRDSSGFTVIDNKSEGATRQLECFGRFTDGTNFVEVNVTDATVWSSDNSEAFTINEGIGGGVITCITQQPTFNGGGHSYLVNDGTEVNVTANYTYNSVPASPVSAIVQINNTPVVNSVRTEPSNNINISIGGSRNVEAFATYTHSNWNSTNTNITSITGSTWTSNHNSIASVSTFAVGGVGGVVSAVSTGVTFINVTNNNITASVQVTVV